MQDLKRNKRKTMTNKVNSEEKHIEELTEELSRACGHKSNKEKHNHCDCKSITT